MLALDTMTARPGQASLLLRIFRQGVRAPWPDPLTYLISPKFIPTKNSVAVPTRGLPGRRRGNDALGGPCGPSGYPNLRVQQPKIRRGDRRANQPAAPPSAHHRNCEPSASRIAVA